MGWSQNTAENPQGSPTVQINGQHFSGVAYELDGAANQDPILGQIVINPPLDAVTEAKITTQNYDAQFGQAVAAVVTAQTKSGTNSFHGDLFDYRRTDATQARNPYNQFAPDPVTGRLLPPAKYNQFGASVGGPIIKNKAFFFADYQGTRQILGSSAIVTVPTALTRSSCLSGNGCDLSDYLTANGPAKRSDLQPPRHHRNGSRAFCERLHPHAVPFAASVGASGIDPGTECAGNDQQLLGQRQREPAQRFGGRQNRRPAQRAHAMPLAATAISATEPPLPRFLARAEDKGFRLLATPSVEPLPAAARVRFSAWILR